MLELTALVGRSRLWHTAILTQRSFTPGGNEISDVALVAACEQPVFPAITVLSGVRDATTVQLNVMNELCEIFDADQLAETLTGQID